MIVTVTSNHTSENFGQQPQLGILGGQYIKFLRQL